MNERAPGVPPGQEDVLAAAVIDSLSAHVAVLDRDGVILRVNSAWEAFARENSEAHPETLVGRNYLHFCESVTDDATARLAAEGLRGVLEGRLGSFNQEYSCHSSTQLRWYMMHVTPLRGSTRGAVVSHEDITGRKLMELDASRLAAIVESSEDAIIGKNLDSVITSWNRGAQKIFGWSAQEMIGASILRLIPPERHAEEIKIIERIRGGQRVEHFETIRVTKSGELIDISVTASPISDSSGTIVGVSKVAREITSRKQAQMALRQSEERYEAVLHNMSEGMVIANLEGELFNWNPAFLAIHEVEESECENLKRLHRVFELFTLDRSPVSTDDWPMARLIRGEQLRDLELRVRKIGQDWERTLSYSGKQIRMSNGEKLAFVVIADITERRRAQARTQRIVEANLHGIFFANACGVIDQANNAFLEMIDFQPGELPHAPAEYALLSAQALEEIRACGVCAPYEKDFVRRDGTRVPALVAAASLPECVDEYVCFVVDLSSRKKLEQQFLRAQRMESIGTLAGGIAHDLNNVLSPILMSLDLLQMDVTSKDAQELIETVRANTRRGADMVKQVLNFARGIEGQRLTVPLKSLLLEVRKVVTDTFNKNIHVSTKIPDDLWPVVGDATQLHQVLLNLCVNARDAMPDGGVLELSARNVQLDAQYAALNLEATPGNYVALDVEDSGTGMPTSVLEQIFDPFFTTKDVGKGTGLGLSTALAIVKGHSGFLRVYSEIGKGTRFSIYLPAASSDPQLDDIPRRVQDLPHGRGELILVVDDETAVRDVTRQTLETFGYKVLVAADGAEALSVYAPRQAEIALVVTDMMMPIMDGAALIQVLMKMNPTVKIVAASGLTANEYLTRATRLGVRQFLFKPFTAETLLKTLRGMLDPGGV